MQDWRISRLDARLKQMQTVLTLLFSISVFCFGTPALAKCSSAKLSEIAAVERPTPACFAVSILSKSLKREIELNVFLPAHYFPRGLGWPYGIFLHGRGGDRNQFDDIGGLHALEALEREGFSGFLVFAPSGGDHYWMNAAISKEKWGDLVSKDLPEWIEANFHVDRKPQAHAIFGLSMGAAGAVQLGFNNPGLFSIAALMSPVFRRESEIWKPNTQSREPKEDYDSFGTGSDYLARSPRHLCEKNRKADGTCLPFSSFRLDAGEFDPFLTQYKDTPKLIEEWRTAHARFPIAIGRCDSPGIHACTAPADCYGHTYAYWSCMTPIQMKWINQQFNSNLRREPAAKAKS